MRYKDGHKKEAHQRLVAAVQRGFRRQGYAGIGVDGLAREARVTSGAFYGHFKSKDAAFREAVVAGMEDLAASIAALQTQNPDGWKADLIDLYLGDKRTCPLEDSCTMQSLSAEVMRAPKATRQAYEARLREVAATASQTTEDAPVAETWALLALLSGGVTLARAVTDPKLAEEIIESVRRIALNM